MKGTSKKGLVKVVKAKNATVDYTDRGMFANFWLPVFLPRYDGIRQKHISQTEEQDVLPTQQRTLVRSKATKRRAPNYLLRETARHTLGLEKFDRFRRHPATQKTIQYTKGTFKWMKRASGIARWGSRIIEWSPWLRKIVVPVGKRITGFFAKRGATGGAAGGAGGFELVGDPVFALGMMLGGVGAEITYGQNKRHSTYARGLRTSTLLAHYFDTQGITINNQLYASPLHHNKPQGLLRDIQSSILENKHQNDSSLDWDTLPPITQKYVEEYSAIANMIEKMHFPRHCLSKTQRLRLGKDAGTCLENAVTKGMLPKRFKKWSLQSLPKNMPGTLDEAEHPFAELVGLGVQINSSCNLPIPLRQYLMDSAGEALANKGTKNRKAALKLYSQLAGVPTEFSSEGRSTPSSNNKKEKDVDSMEELNDIDETLDDLKEAAENVRDLL